MQILTTKVFNRPCLAALAALLLSSCYNDPQFLGSNLIPGNDIYSVKVDSTFELSAYTVRPQSDTLGYSSGVFGYVNSEIFGSTKASFVSRYITTASTEEFGAATAKPDSLIFSLSLPTTALYSGDSTKALAVNVHELTDTAVLWKPDILRSIEGRYNPTPLATFTFRGGQKSVKVPIDTSFARLLLDSVALADNKAFYTKFKGLYVTCEELSGYGGVAYQVTSLSFTLSLYYHYTKRISNKDSVFTKSRHFSASPWYYYQYTHDYTKANPAKAIRYLNDSTAQDTVFYTQGLSGVYGKIQLDGVTQWLDSMPVVLHRAELVVGRQTPENAAASPTTSTLNLRYKESNQWVMVQTGIYSMPGTLRLYRNDYSVDVTSHLQRILEGEITDRNLYVFRGNDYVEPAGEVLHSGSSSRKMKLKLTYTKLR